MQYVVLLDLVCPKPYSLTTLQTEPLGGSEATLVRVAQALAKSGENVVVAQHNRPSDETHEGVEYVGIDTLDRLTSVKAAIVSRLPVGIPYVQKKWPDAKRFLWTHDFSHEHLVQDVEILRGTKIICVSRTHQQVTANAFLSQADDLKGITVDFVYNPIDDDLKPDNTEVLHRRYVFFSSPHKGLKHTLSMFEKIRANDRHSELYVANPGYLPDHDSWPEGVTNLGPLPHHKALEYVRSAFCVLNLNDEFPETFGLVFAESAAVGTPTLTAPIGASREVLGNRDMTVDVKNEQAVIERLQRWQTQGRPTPQVNPEFRVSNVVNRWKGLIG